MYSGKGKQMERGVKAFACSSWHSQVWDSGFFLPFSCAVDISSTVPLSFYRNALVKPNYLKALIQILLLSKHQVMTQNSKLSFPSLNPACSGSSNMKDNSLGQVVTVIPILDHFSSLWWSEMLSLTPAQPLNIPSSFKQHLKLLKLLWRHDWVKSPINPTWHSIYFKVGKCTLKIIQNH